MGRLLLLLVASVSVTGAYFVQSRAGVRNDLSQRQASTEEVALARQAAQSGFDDALHEFTESPATRPSATGRTMGDGAGSYDFETELSAYGSTVLTSRGAYGAGRYVVQGEVLSLLRTGAAVTVHGEEFEGKIKDDAVIDGNDHRVPGAPGSAGPAGANPGIAFTDRAVRLVAEDKWGTVPPGVIGGTALIAQPEAIAELAKGLVLEPSTITVEKFELEEDEIGSPLAPVVVHVTDEATFKEGAVGYGVLIVDGDLKMEEDARWEGLVIIRAEAGEKRSVKLSGTAEIVGSVVLLGAEFMTEGDASPGFPGGHMDLDLFEGDGGPLPRTYHKHQWDDKYDLTTLDFFSGPDIGPDFSRFTTDVTDRRGRGASLRVEFENAFNSSGSYTIGSYSGRTEAGFDAVMKVSDLRPFVVRFDALCALRGTSPGRVKSDPVDRDRSFSVRFYDGAKLVYAVSAYEHAKTLRDGSPTCGSSSGGDSSEADVYGEFKLELKDDSAIHYSEEANGRIARTSTLIRDLSRTFPVLLRSVPTIPPRPDVEPPPVDPPVDPPVVDPPPGSDVTVCHKPGPKQKTKVLPPEDVPSHLGHGDTLGACTGG